MSYDSLYDGVPLADGRVFKHITTALNPGVPLTEDLKIRMAASVPITASYGNNGLGRHIDFGIIFAEGGLTLYWPGQRYSTGLEFTGPNAFHMEEQDWFKIGFAAPGPGHARTRMYLDTPSGHWLISNVSRCPPQPDGSQPISTISDLSLANLMERAAKPWLPGTDTVIFLADRDGTLIYHPERQDQIHKTNGKASIVSTGDAEMRPILEQISARSLKPGEPQIATTSDRLIAFGIIPGTDWVLAIRYPKALMRPAIVANLGIVAAVGLFTLFVELFVLRSILQNQVAKPLSRLIGATRRLADPASGFSTGSLPPDSNDEIGDLSGAFATMAEQLRKAFQETRASEEKLRTILDLSPLPISWMNRQGGIEFWNRQALELFGYSFEEIDTLEKWFVHGYPDPACRKEASERWNASIAKSEAGHIQRGDYTITCKDGRVLTVEVTGTRYGELTIAIFNDITQRKLADEELRRHRDNLEELVSARTAELRLARDQADVANKAKSTFLANMSHEIRTPMTAILGFAQILSRDRSLSSEQRQQIDTINHAGGDLLAIINDILEMSKIEAGRTTVVLCTFDLHALLEHLVEICRVRAAAKGIELALERAPEVPRWILSDEGKLRQTLLNLLGNAVKFTNAGSVRMRADVPAAEGENLTLRFTIADTGPGIPEEDVERLFQPFYQTSITISGEGGTGLGLAISKQYADTLGGTIDVKSEPGLGSIFTLTIPARAAGEDAGIEQPAHPVIRRLAPNQPPVRILVVDDYPLNRELLRSTLEPLGFEVRLAADGREAVDAYQAWHPHAILMDMCMPVMDGYEANRRIRATAAGNDTLIVALTASAFEEGKADILASGADVFVRKPFQQEALLELLGERLGLQYERSETEAKVREVSARNCSVKITKAIRAV